MIKLRVLVTAWVVSVVWGTVLWAQSAQDVVWVQIEAHPSLITAQERARIYAGELEDVNGFAMGSGWYGITLGPYRRADADQVLRVYRREGVIPRDSYIAFTDTYRQQFWPIGANILNRGVIEALPPVAAEPDTPTPTAQTDPQTDIAAQENLDENSETTRETDTATALDALQDETPAQARQSERRLNRAEREELQIALKWAGYYTAAIDGAFGRGTRASMAAWQEANGVDPTGILTTAQRVALLRQYNAVLDGMDLTLVRDDAVGIEMLIPKGVVAFDTYDYPFAKFTPTGDIPAQVLMISQEGDQTTLFGLYDIMQTLEIVPLDGRRERANASFTLVGESERIISHTEASLRNGQIKGFTLVWPAGDEARRTRILDQMRASFSRIDGVLDPTQSASDEQAIDLVAGLQIRVPRLSRSGFFVSGSGDVVTTLPSVQNCGRITLDQETDAQLVAADDRLGIAVLRPAEAIVPRAVAAFAGIAPRLQSEVAASGFSYGGVLGSPSVSFGTLADLRGLRGQEDLTRLDMATLEGDAGGPVFDEAGSVLGMLLPRDGSDRQLPPEVSFAADGNVILSLLRQSGVDAMDATSRAPMAPEDITAQARDMTVLVSCWE